MCACDGCDVCGVSLFHPLPTIDLNFTTCEGSCKLKQNAQLLHIQIYADEVTARRESHPFCLYNYFPDNKENNLTNKIGTNS